MRYTYRTARSWRQVRRLHNAHTFLWVFATKILGSVVRFSGSTCVDSCSGSRCLVGNIQREKAQGTYHATRSVVRFSSSTARRQLQQQQMFGWQYSTREGTRNLSRFLYEVVLLRRGRSYLTKEDRVILEAPPGRSKQYGYSHQCQLEKHQPVQTAVLQKNSMLYFV